jgi:hypothetical protein
MALLSDPRMDTVVLSAGGMWVKEIKPDVGTQWPDGTTYTRFLDSAGGLIAQLDGTVTPQAISYEGTPDDTDVIPAGAGFETFLVTDSKPYKIRYGRVIRKEVTFPNSPAVNTQFQALQFADTFQRSALGSKWVPVSGRTAIFTNGGGKPRGVGNNYTLLYNASSIRYFQPFNGDSIRSSVTLLNPGAGKTTLILSANQNFTSFLGVQFDTTGADKLRVVIGSGPTSMTAQTEVSVTIADFDRYMAFYDELTNTVSVYKGASLTPTLTWTDEFNTVPHGPGYRYVGFAWQASLLTTGPQITNWIGQDDVGGAVDGS